MRRAVRGNRLLVASLLLALLSACGREDAAPLPADGLEVEGSSLSFSAIQGQPQPPQPQSLVLRVDKAKAQRIGAGPAPGETGDWFTARIDGQPPELKLVVSITRTTLPPGDYRAKLAVALGDEQENILQMRELDLHYRVMLKP